MNYIAVLFIIGLLILIHELGHFLAARAVGIGIETFSVGFGPALWKKRSGDTEYRFSLVPLGGYVLPATADENDYFRIPVYKRIIFSLGGPAANLALMLPLIALYNALGAGFTAAGVFVEPFRQTGTLLLSILGSLQGLFTRPDSMSGIVGIMHQGGRFIDGDALHALRLAFILSANLAVFNLLPLPVLDGGKIILCLLEKMHHRLRNIYVPVMVAGWILIIGLMIYATVLDAGRLIKVFS
ncbi:MAG TPA: site-2 protease family protein [Spirochaetota bacterium]|nr:site-2 protease family protein [Spirochaetota bacterium]HOD15313.1 site-2 protease family protein [Spirochaetota bacterium]HPG50901.1 site-2 protease family protein [Spirochaetota bacterium]HPN13842.1 site-2 protease family protein [Spirochaetota bacterium]HQL82483.1 site-2 protease family protein [Spirochaetota bacterium]